MKKLTLFFPLLFLYNVLYSQNVAINTSGANANASAILDLSNTGNMAFLAPQVSLTNVTTLAPVPGPGPAGLLVYNTNAAVTGGSGTGYYSWNGALWNFLGGSGATVSGANSGTSLNGTNVILGNAYGGTVGQLLANTEIPFNGFNIDFSGTTGKIGIDLAASTTAAQALEIGQTNNTIRVNGLKAGSTFNVAPAATTTYMLYANTNGDIYSMPAGATNNVLTWTATGPAWGSTSGTAWQITGNTGIVASTSAINAAANNNFIGTTTGADFVLAANNFERMRIASGGNVGFSNIAPTTMVQIGNAATTTGKLSVFSQDFQYGQIQIGNPAANSEASMQFISNVSTFGSAATSASGTAYSWNIGAGTYAKGGNKFIISNLQYGEIMTFTSAGQIGIGNTMTSPAQEVEVGGTTTTVRIDGLNAAGTVYNQASATNVGNLVYANNVTGDLWAIPHTAVASTLVSSATGVISWQAGTVPTGSGIINYLARWTPSGTQLGTGVAQDNGLVMVVQNTASAFPVGTIFTANGNATNTNGILGTTTTASSYGIRGSNTATTGTSAGVQGFIGAFTAATVPSGIFGTTNTASTYGVLGNNTQTNATSVGTGGYLGALQTPQFPSGVYGSTTTNASYGVEGYNSQAVNTGGAGVYGYQGFPGTGIIGTDATIGTFGYYLPPNGVGMNGFGLYNGVQGTYVMTAPGGTGVLGLGYNNIGARDPNPTGIYDFGVAGEIGGPTVGGYTGAGVGGFIGTTTNSSNYTSAVMGGSNFAAYPGVLGFATTSTGIGVEGINNAGSSASQGPGVEGISSQTAGGAVEGFNIGATGTGVIGSGNNLGGYTYLNSGQGGAFTGTAVGAFGFARTVGSGVGVVGVGNNDATIITYAAGSGGAFTGVTFGSTDYSTGASSTGTLGVGNNSAAFTLGTGSGGAFCGTSFGLFARTTSSTNPSGAIETYNNATGNTVYVDYWNGTNYKILGTSPGTVSCSVLDDKGNSVVMHAPETPEAYYEDYGQGQLVNGKIHIDLDPVYAKNICVNEKHPLRVFIQLEGDCKGVYVTNKTATGFDVFELNGGTSNISFQYHIIGNQADAIMPSGVVSKFADLRFEPTPVPEKQISQSALPSEIASDKAVEPSTQTSERRVKTNPK